MNVPAKTSPIQVSKSPLGESADQVSQFCFHLVSPHYPFHVHSNTFLSESCKDFVAKPFRSQRRNQRTSMPMQPIHFPIGHIPAFPPTLEEDISPTETATNLRQPEKDPPDTVTGDVSRSLQAPRFPSVPAPCSSLHGHRGSASTAASADSVTSSPTAASLAESFSNTDTPATSPDTPASTQSLSSPSLMQATHFQSLDKLEHLRQPAPKEFGRPSTAPKRARNLKNLAVDTSGATTYGRPAATATLPLQQPRDYGMISAPMSPTFVKPMKPPRRKASALGLSIVTPASDSPPAKEDPAPVPQTPSLSRPGVLRHFPSSPSLPLQSPGVPPEGGMQLPPLATRRNISVGFAEAPCEQEEGDHTTNLEDLESKAQGYPDGPICIYDPHVYLFNEPSAEQASDFDVVFNVASEVNNPFLRRDSPSSNEEKSIAVTSAVIGDSEDSSFRTAPSSPTSFSEGTITEMSHRPPQPEYIHVPWEHNTDIVPDLYDLVKVIDEKVLQEKKVLIHCQCGVSRSASLIVAYGLYKNPSINVQEAYDAVKRRSKWIGPNMSLIMQLQEFRTELLKISAGMPSKHGRARSKTRILLDPTPNHERVKSPDRTTDASSTDGPHSAPLPPETQKPDITLSKQKSDSLVTPGPSSAPSGVAWPRTPHDVDSRAARAVQENETSVKDAPQDDNIIKLDVRPENTRQFEKPPVPILGKRPLQLALPFSNLARFQQVDAPNLAVESPRAAEFAMASAQPPPMDDTFGLTSPRASVFGAINPLAFKSSSQIASQHANINRSAFTLTSPRSQEFAMTSIRPLSQDDDLGITSPRKHVFSTQLPRLFPAPSSKATAFSALYPPEHPNNSSSQTIAHERASLRSRLGMSTRSSYDMRSEYVLAARARELAPVLSPPPGTRQSRESDDSISDALSSPRAFEFIKNRLHEPAASEAARSTLSPIDENEGEKNGIASPQSNDPRSPAYTGASPIVRNIFEVF